MRISTLTQMHKAFHQEAHRHAGAMVAAHEKELAKETPSTPFHKAAVESWKQVQAHHEAAIAECEKAALSESALEKSGDGEVQWLAKYVDERIEEAIGNTVEPVTISKLAPNRPAPGSVLVPRFGSPEPAKPDVPAEFLKLTVVDED